MIRAMLQRKTTKLINKHLLLSLVVLAFASTSADLSHAQKNQATAKKKSSDTSLTSEDRIFLELREASKNNDASKARDLGQKLSNYDVADYVSYFQIKPRLFDKGGAPRAETNADDAVDRWNAGAAIIERGGQWACEVPKITAADGGAVMLVEAVHELAPADDLADESFQ